MSEVSTPWAQVSALLDQALDLSPAELDTWLSELDSTQPSIAAELRTLLAHKAKVDAKNFLGENLQSLGYQPGLVGQRVGAYTFESLLGAGGMGTVWLARRSDGRFDGQVAIKLLNIALVGRPSEQRFVREGDVLAKLQHPNIARLLDAGVAEHGQPYLVLEHVQGERIDDYCRRRRLDIAASIRIFLDVLSAVSHAHNHLVVHRDLKPPNILITHDGVAKLLDFGVATLLADESAKPDLTREIGAAFTPEYAAPEQLGEQGITTATDVYALGLVLFVLLAGRHPVAREGISRAELLRKMQDEDPPAASTLAESASAKRVLRGDLDNIIAKALSRAPEHRYPSAAAFADDLRRYLAFKPIGARPASLAYRSGKFMRRNALAMGISAVVAIALVGTTAFALAQMLEARSQRDNARFEARRAEATSEFMSLVFEEVGPSGEPQTLRQLLDRGVALLEKQNGGDPAILSRMLVQASRRYLDLGENSSQRKLLERAIALAQPAGAHDVLASAHCAGVRGLIEAGRLPEAKEQLRLGEVALAQQTGDRINPRIDCLRAKAEIFDDQDKADEALAALNEARKLLESAGNTRTTLYTSVINDAGIINARLGRFGESLAADELVMQIFERNGRSGTVAMTSMMSNRAMDLSGAGEILAAEAGMRAVAAREEGAPHMVTLVNQGNQLLQLERVDQAMPLFQQTVKAAAAAENLSVELAALALVARAHIMRGEFEDAEAKLAQVESRFPADPQQLVIRRRFAEFVRIELLWAKQETGAARLRGDNLLKSVGYPGAGDRQILNRLLPLMARVSLQERDPLKVRAYASAALELARGMARPGGHSAHVGQALLLLAEADALEGKHDAARRSAQDAFAQLQGSLGLDHSSTRRAKELVEREDLKSPPPAA